MTMPEIHVVLGGGSIEYSGSAVVNDPAGRSGELVMGTSQANGRSAFRLVLHNLGFKPTSARVTRYTVTGLSADGCKGNEKCSQNGLLAQAVQLSPPTANNYGHYFFNASGHDGSVLTSLMTQCGCSSAGVRSVCVTVQVEVLPAPKPAFDMEFKFCFECHVVER